MAKHVQIEYPNHFNMVLFWEHYIREGKKLMLSYNTVIGLFLSISIACIIVGVLFPLKMLDLSTGTHAHIIAILIIVGSIIFLVYVGGLYLKEIKSATSKSDSHKKLDKILYNKNGNSNKP